ncbi:hypothetical protein H0O02_02255 [Candidatus Micrarchaeota archaeon]|nr:hypothetical protein [Candidatus Micrarchaeota archaeon]
MAKMEFELQRMRDAVVSTSPASVLNNIFDKYAGKGLGGQERNIRPVLSESSSISSLVKSYTRRMYSGRMAVRSPVGIARTADIPKQEYRPVDSSCDASMGTRDVLHPHFQIMRKMP